jgi:hypothetical protein
MLKSEFPMFRRFLSLACLLALPGLASVAQQRQHWTERRNLGFEGPVRSALTTVLRPNPDPRSSARRKLMVEGNPDWAVFDTQGRRIEFASSSSRDRVEAISQCTFQTDGTMACTNGTGRTEETRRKEITLPDRSREITYFRNSSVDSREVTLFDEKGTAVGSRNYDKNGKLTSENLTLVNGDGEWKIYDEKGRTVLDQETRESEDKTRFDRWSYDSEGKLAWHLALNDDGQVVSYWYKIGYKPSLSSSDSLGICRPQLCVSYKFDDEGSGRMEKLVQHTSGMGNFEPDIEEHYDFDGTLDEKAEIKYVRDDHGNWTSRSVFVWDAASNQMIQVEQDTRTIEYY